MKKKLFYQLLLQLLIFFGAGKVLGQTTTITATLPDPCSSALQTSEISSKGSFTIFPNPTSNVVNIRLDEITRSERINVKIYDLAGKIVFSQNNFEANHKDVTLRIERLVAGVYFISVESNGNMATKKLIINK